MAFVGIFFWSFFLGNSRVECLQTVNLKMKLRAEAKHSGHRRPSSSEEIALLQLGQLKALIKVVENLVDSYRSHMSTPVESRLKAVLTTLSTK